MCSPGNARKPLRTDGHAVKRSRLVGWTNGPMYRSKESISGFGRTDGRTDNPKTYKKILMSVLGLNSKDRKSTRDKANMYNPKVNGGCTQLTANRISADCVQISLGPSLPYIPLGVYHTGGFSAMCRYRASNIITKLGWPVYIMSDKIELMVSIIHKTQCV